MIRIEIKVSVPEPSAALLVASALTHLLYTSHEWGDTGAHIHRLTVEEADA